MLNRTSVEQGLLLATALDNAGLEKCHKLTPIPGSPLDKLVRITGHFDKGDNYAQYLKDTVDTAATDADRKYADDISIDAIVYHTNSIDPVTEECPHDTVMDELRQKLSPSVLHQLSHAKNVVRPMICEIAELVITQLSRKMDSALLNAEVIEIAPPVIFNDAALVAELEKYEGMNYNPDLLNNFALPPLSEEELRQLILTNKESTDANILTWLSAEEDGWLEKLYKDFITAETSLKNPGNLHSFLRQTTTVYNRNLPNIDICKAIGLFLLADGLYNNPPEGTNVALAEYNRYMSDLRDSLGALLNNERAEYYRAVNEDQELVVYVEGTKVYVRSDLYAIYLADGGDVDVLYGNSLRNKPYITMGDIKINADELRNTWHRHVAIARAAEEQNLLNTTRRLFNTVLIDVLSKLDDDKKKQADRVAAIWKDQMESVTNNELKDIYGLTTRLVCRAIYPETDAEYYLVSINKIMENNPKIDPREAPSIATIEYIVEWCLKQVTVRS